MNWKGIKLAVGILAGTVVIAGIQMSTSAAGISSILPVAGLALVLEEGMSVQAIKNEVEQTESKETPSENKILKIDPDQPVSVSTLLGANDVKNPPVVTVNKTEDITGESVSENVIPKLPEKTEPKVEEAVVPEDTSVSANVVEEPVLTKEEVEKVEEEKYFSTLVIAKVNDYVNVRSTPSEDGEIVGKLYDKSVGEFLSESNGWYEIKSGNCTGFVKAEYVVTGDAAIALAKEVGHRLATVTTTTLFVRKEASENSACIGMVPIEDSLTVLEELENWVKVSVEEGEGYVSREFVNLHTEFVKAESKEEEEARKKKEEEAAKAARAAAQAATAQSRQQSSNTNQGSTQKDTYNPPVVSGDSAMGGSVSNFALQFLGNPYVYGGTSLTNGADCSGFTSSVYRNFGVSLPRTSGSQRSTGYDVGGIGNAQPGDLVCYSGHVGIYIGGGNIVHASTEKTGIIVSNATYRPILAVRRIF